MATARHGRPGLVLWSLPIYVGLEPDQEQITTKRREISCNFVDRSFVSLPVLDNHIDILQQINMPEHITADRNDVRILPFTHRAHLI